LENDDCPRNQTWLGGKSLINGVNGTIICRLFFLFSVFDYRRASIKLGGFELIFRQTHLLVKWTRKLLEDVGDVSRKKYGLIIHTEHILAQL
jgi:hypothetical protein